MSNFLMIPCICGSPQCRIIINNSTNSRTIEYKLYYGYFEDYFNIRKCLARIKDIFLKKSFVFIYDIIISEENFNILRMFDDDITNKELYDESTGYYMINDTLIVDRKHLTFANFWQYFKYGNIQVNYIKELYYEDDNSETISKTLYSIKERCWLDNSCVN